MNESVREPGYAVRQPCVAGTFYPAEPATLRRSVAACLPEPSPQSPPGLLVMLPHAGYVYCGEVIGATLAAVTLPSRLILLGPNHTGQGAPLAVWPEGQWLTPLGAVPVDASLAAALCDLDVADGAGGVRPAGFVPDSTAHLREHSLEVLLPFLQCRGAAPGIVPVCVGTGDMRLLERAGMALANLLESCATHGEPVGLIVSSDMHHFSTHERTLELDAHALDPILRLDPRGLAEVVNRERISMCGVCPMIMALVAVRKLGASKASLVRHTTSAAASGDSGRVVGYAGVCVCQSSPTFT